MVRVEDTDPYRYIAWKDGEFVFERENDRGGHGTTWKVV